MQGLNGHFEIVCSLSGLAEIAEHICQIKRRTGSIFFSETP